MHFLGDMFHFTFEKIVTVMSYMDATCDLYSSIHMCFLFSMAFGYPFIGMGIEITEYIKSTETA